MAFEEVLSTMRESIQTSLDELASPRLSPSAKSRALRSLERHLATACCNDEAKDSFLALQLTFECNIPAHLLPWLTLSTFRLEGLTSRSLSEDERASEMDELTSQVNLSLSLIQGIVLNHTPSKDYLGRRASLEILLDLLLVSRHVPCPSDGSTDSSSKTLAALPHVTSTILDTLLCILVDSTAALRSFEEANGVQAVVKILKRAGTPREVRMKCLEFLYFYLLDETPSQQSASCLDPTIAALLKSAEPPTAPATPIKPTSKPYFAGTPARPMSRYGSSTFSFSEACNTSSSSSGSSTGTPAGGSVPRSVLVGKTLRSISGSSAKSFSSTSSNASSSDSTAPSSVDGGDVAGNDESSPAKKETQSTRPKVFSPPPQTPAPSSSRPKASRMMTPPAQTGRAALTSPLAGPPAEKEKANRFPQVSAQPRSLLMLRKDVDYTPLSPKKVLVVGVGKPPPGTPGAPGTPAGGAIEGAEREREREERERRRAHRKSLSVSTANGNGAGPGSIGPVPPIPVLRKRSDGTERSPVKASTLADGASSPLKSEASAGVVREPSLGTLLTQEIKEKHARSRKEKEKGTEKENVSADCADSSSEKESLNRSRWKTTEEKKELLGTMLGNVDALVEGVRKAGIWGLG